MSFFKKVFMRDFRYYKQTTDYRWPEAELCKRDYCGSEARYSFTRP